MTRKEIRQLLGMFGLLTQLGLTITVAILLGGGLGVALERGVGLGKVGLLVGILTGVGGAAVGAYQLVRQSLGHLELGRTGGARKLAEEDSWQKKAATLPSTSPAESETPPVKTSAPPT